VFEIPELGFEMEPKPRIAWCKGPKHIEGCNVRRRSRIIIIISRRNKKKQK
jgi:hypothetical protein